MAGCYWSPECEKCGLEAVAVSVRSHFVATWRIACVTPASLFKPSGVVPSIRVPFRITRRHLRLERDRRHRGRELGLTSLPWRGTYVYLNIPREHSGTLGPR